jgi:outer membrane protein
MMTISRHIFLTAAIALAGFSASAQELKIGIVNLDRIFREANSAKTAQTKLEQEFGKREKDLNDVATQLKTLSDKYEREAPTLSETQRATRQKQLVDQDRDFQRKRREFQEDLNARKNEELQQVIERANRVVKTLAEAEKYDLIVQEAVYVNPKHDITDKVLKSLNATNGR